MTEPASRKQQDTQWTAVDQYLADVLLPPDAALDEALRASVSAGLPAQQVTPVQGMLLRLLAQSIGATSILEIGTLGGYSTIWLGGGLAPGGRLITLEANPKHAAVARSNLARAGLADRVDVCEGRAIDTLALLGKQARGPFDLFFIDADKASNPEYFTWALNHSRVGSLIIVDNVVRAGAVADAASDDVNVEGARRLVELVGNEPRVQATVVQTVGSKGYDGFLIARVDGR